MPDVHGPGAALDEHADGPLTRISGQVWLIASGWPNDTRLNLGIPAYTDIATVDSRFAWHGGIKLLSGPFYPVPMGG